MRYNVEIRETLSRVISVNANSEQGALAIAQGVYYSEQVILDDSDLVDTDFIVN